MPTDVFTTLESEGIRSEQLDREGRRALAARLYQQHRLSFGKAAQLAGLCHADFGGLLIEMGIPIVEYTEADYEHDLMVIAELRQ